MNKGVMGKITLQEKRKIKLQWSITMKFDTKLSIAGSCLKMTLVKSLKDCWGKW